jgi:hypothetical protein
MYPCRHGLTACRRKLDVDCQPHTVYSLHPERNSADDFRFALRRTGLVDQPNNFASEGIQAGLSKSIMGQEIFLIGE